MDALSVALASAFWLGLLTAISPCPLATNIAAISYIGREVGAPRQVLFTGLAYTLGRAVTYLVIAVILVASIVSVPTISNFLQLYMNKLLGPLLILVGMFLLNLIRLSFTTSCGTRALEERFKAWGVAGAGLLGMLFALTFCPVSAALYFGSLIPLAVRSGSTLAVPSMYGLGTGLPVFGFAILVALGAQSVSRVFNRLSQVERWARPLTGCVFIIVGIYFSLTYIFEVFA